MKILAICPSIYPEKLEKMMDSFLVTRSKHTEIAINYEIKPITKIFNDVFNANPDYDFYFMCNDDLIFTTPLWDLELANKGKISWGYDGIQGSNLCCFPMIDGNIVRALGWLQMPLLEMYCGDVVWNFIGKQCNILNYNPSAVIAHTWKEEQVDLNVHKTDMGRFAEWLPHSHKDIERVKKCLKLA